MGHHLLPFFKLRSLSLSASNSICHKYCAHQHAARCTLHTLHTAHTCTLHTLLHTAQLAHILSPLILSPLTHSSSRPLIHSPTHPLILSTSHPLTDSPTHPLTHSPKVPAPTSGDTNLACLIRKDSSLVCLGRPGLGALFAPDWRNVSSYHWHSMQYGRGEDPMVWRDEPVPGKEVLHAVTHGGTSSGVLVRYK
jgi:hypothetical protein